jgi:hypothetical protein
MAATIGIAGCRLFVDLDGLTGGPDHDAAPEAQHDVVDTTDATDVATGSDATDAGDGDGLGFDSSDAPTPCTLAIPLLGSDVIAGKGSDGTPNGATDATGFTAAKAGVAQCAWFWVENIQDASGGMDVSFGVYTNGAGDSPDTLIAKATLKSVVPGWNKAPLDVPVTLSAGEDLWIGITPSTGAVGERVSGTCGPRLYEHADSTDPTLPTKFKVDATFTDTCSMTAYIGP